MQGPHAIIKNRPDMQDDFFIPSPLENRVVLHCGRDFGVPPKSVPPSPPGYSADSPCPRAHYMRIFSPLYSTAPRNSRRQATRFSSSAMSRIWSSSYGSSCPSMWARICRRFASVSHSRSGDVNPAYASSRSPRCPSARWL